MRCNKGPFEMCPECNKKFLVNFTTTFDTEVYYCFNFYESAKDFFDIIETSEEFDGIGIMPGTAILFVPDPESAF